MDPLVDETGQPYAYTGDDPVNLTDPIGAISAGQICGMDGLNSPACKGAVAIVQRVGQEVAANQVGGNASRPFGPHAQHGVSEADSQVFWPASIRVM